MLYPVTCEQTLNIKYQTWSDVFDLSAGEYIISGASDEEPPSVTNDYEQSAKALLIGTTAGGHIQNATEKVTTYWIFKVYF